MGAGKIRSIKNRIKINEKRYSEIGLRISKGKSKASLNFVKNRIVRDKMTEQYDATESDLKQKVEEKRKELKDKEAEICTFNVKQSKAKNY